jgi:hypothetical protein
MADSPHEGTDKSQTRGMKLYVNLLLVLAEPLTI